MIDPPWMPRTEEEYQQQLAEDAGPQPDEMVRLQQALDGAEQEIERLMAECDQWHTLADALADLLEAPAQDRGASQTIRREAAVIPHADSEE
jgi:hypothetical protein